MHAFAGDPPVEEDIGELLRESETTVAVVETVTGGMVTALLTGVPGASAYVDRGFVPYSYDALREQVGATRERLDADGVVSAPVTRQLARRARDVADATWGVATTGVAGPGGGTPEKPVGTAYVAVAHAAPWGSEASGAAVQAHEFEGDRKAIRERTSRAALALLAENVADAEPW
jgi:nicotinamide-nucleotide amidase